MSGKPWDAPRNMKSSRATYWGLSKRPRGEGSVFQRARSWPQKRTGRLIIDPPVST
jgi:hypothetical protein